jgi:lipid A 3-O-deacylase
VLGTRGGLRICRTLILAGLLAGWAVLCAVPSARADGILSDDGEPDFLTMGVGYFDVFKDKNAGIFNLEYRSSKQFFYLRPHVGMFGTTDGGFYAYTGVRLDIFLGRRFVLSPNFSPGFYFEGSGKDLGFVMEFRSGVELGYRFDNRGRLTAAIHHLSNASLGDRNPGTETVTLYYSLPLDGILGNGDE